MEAINISQQNDQLKLLKNIRTTSIISLVLIFTLIGAIVTLVLDIINAIRILSTKWVKQEIENNKLIWGIFTIIVLGPISSLIFSCIAINKYNDPTEI
ncbi:MAG: hypothetical protein K2I36_00295 [Ureaplasma sp.]|nr:hypothetical protein [Ureaplasma sp.]